ncbi:hypothetical protein BC830DRAFT_236712 [Chytriomyces sp. MP71]|nr:hypothetical protein BC830DRAFT_236712 [Chytriomyces sp. MP71]
MLACQYFWHVFVEFKGIFDEEEAESRPVVGPVPFYFVPQAPMSSWIALHKHLTGRSSRHEDIANAEDISEDRFDDSDDDEPSDDEDEVVDYDAASDGSDWESEESGGSDDESMFEHEDGDEEMGMHGDGDDDEAEEEGEDGQHFMPEYDLDSDSESDADDASEHGVWAENGPRRRRRGGHGRSLAGIINTEQTSSIARIVSALRSFGMIAATTLERLSLEMHQPVSTTFAFHCTRERIESNLALIDIFHRGIALLDLSALEHLGQTLSVDESWFGGRLPYHPMFFAGWKGNPYIILKKIPHWTKSDRLVGLRLTPTLDEEQRDTSVPLPSAAESHSLLNHLEKIHTLLFSAWMHRQSAILDSFGSRPNLANNGDGILLEIMSKCNIAMQVRMDWWPDWHTSTAMFHENSSSINTSYDANEGNVISDEVDPNDPIVAILLTSSHLNFVVTSKGHPYQWAHSASDAYHHQCARYMVLGPNELCSFFPLDATPEPIPNTRGMFPHTADVASNKLEVPPGTLKIHLQRPWTVIGRNLLRGGKNTVADCRSALQRVEMGLYGCVVAPDVFPFTKYLARSDHDLVQPKEEGVMSLPAQVVSMDMAFGFLAIGFDDGLLAAFCVAKGIPRLVLYQVASYRFDMFNSVHLSRRIVHKISEGDVADENTSDWEYEYSLLVTRNSGYVDVHILTKHGPEKLKEEIPTGGKMAKSDLAEQFPALSLISPHHDLSTKCKETISGFIGPVNDARLSPNGRFLACVGDRGGAWIAHVTYSTGIEGDEEDAGNSTLKNRHFGQVTKINMDYLFTNSANSIISISEEAAKNAGRNTRESRASAVANRARDASRLTMQYLSWSCDSRFFAATTDTYPWVFIFDAHRNGNIVCRLDAGTPTYAVTFHPTKPHVLAFSNRMGYIHIVDISEFLSSLDTPCTSLPSGKQPFGGAPPPFVYPPRQILRQDYKVPIEPRSGSYPDLPSLAQVNTRNTSLGSFGTGPTTGRLAAPSSSNNPFNFTNTSQNYLQESYSTVSCKVNGILWSDDGDRLYVSTNRRVLMYSVSERTAASLAECVSRACIWDQLEERVSAEDLEIMESIARDLIAGKRWVGHWE